MNKEQAQTFSHIKYMHSLGQQDSTLEKAIRLIEELTEENKEEN
jgi:hypothetical protein